MEKSATIKIGQIHRDDLGNLVPQTSLLILNSLIIKNFDQLCARETSTNNGLNKEDIYLLFSARSPEASSLGIDFMYVIKEPGSSFIFPLHP